MNIKEFNEVYEMYMKKSKEELAMILTINDYNKSMEITEQVNDKLMESIMESINLPQKTVEGKDTTPQDLVKKPEPKKPYNWNDPDMFKIHPEDGPIFEDNPEDIHLGTYCPYSPSGKCDRCGGLCSVCPLYQKSIITTTTSDTTTSSDDIKLEEVVSTFNIYTYCPFVKGGKCVKGDNRLCDGCEHNPQPSLKEYPKDSTTTTKFGPNQFVFTNSTVNC